MSKSCYTCRMPIGKWDTSGECQSCRDAVWRERSAPTRVPASREVIEQEIRDLLARKMAEAEVEQVVTRTAYHEAGHCVVALELGLPVDEVWINFGRGGETRTRRHWGTAVPLALAGALAERMFLGHDDAEGCEGDLAMAYAAWQRGESDLGDVDQVGAILRRRAGDVRAIAEALLEHERLSGGDVEAVLRAADTATARSEVPGQRLVECRDGSVRYVSEEHYRSCVRDFAGTMELA